MSRFASFLTLLITASALTAVVVPAQAHFDDKQIPQSYRQSWFALLAANFGPMVATVKGEIPWDEQLMKGWSNDLATLTTLNIKRGFVDGAEGGTTRAKPAIWNNKADFEAKMQDMRDAVLKLQQTTATGDREAIAEQVNATGGACKACHDDYKSENYLD